MRHLWPGVAVAALLSCAAAGAETLAIRNARLYPVSAEPIPSGTIVAVDGRIHAIGADVAIPEGATVIDAGGRSVMPGLVESHSHMGMKRLWIPADLDNNEISGAINAQTRAIDSIDTTDRAFHIALTAGVTTMNVTNGSRTPNGGQPAVLKLRGGTVDDMYYAPGGMKIALRTTFRERGLYPTTHMGVVAVLREHLIAARRYTEAWERHRADPTSARPHRDLKLEALGRVLNGELVVGAHASSALEMLNALRLREEFGLDLFIHHGTALVDVVEEVAAAGVAVSFGPVLPGRSRESERLMGPVRLAELGGKVVFHQDHPDGPQYYLRHSGALFVRRGMPYAEALKALTLNAAELFHLEDRIGSLEVGKDADFIVLSGEPLDWESHVDLVIVEGRKVYDRETGEAVFPAPHRTRGE